MKRLACLVALALAVPCPAAGPRADHTSKMPPRPRPMVTVGGQLAFIPMGNPPPEPLLSDRRIRTVLLPDATAAEWFLERRAERRRIARRLAERAGQ